MIEWVYLGCASGFFTALAVISIRDTDAHIRRHNALDLIDEYTVRDEGWRETLNDIHDLPEVTA